MGTGSIRRVEEHGGGRIGASERAVVTDIGPNPPSAGLQLRQHRRVIAVDALGGEHVRLDQLVERRQDGRAGADMIGHGRDRELDPLAGILLALPVERLFSTSIIASRLGPAKPRAMAWNGAGGCVIVSQDRQLNFSRTCLVTSHCRGMTSSVSVTSSPIFESLVPPQHGHEVGAG
jgi:hypothetical protein